MDLLTLALLAVAAYLVYRYFSKQLSYFEDRGVPYVPGWPFFGNMASAFFQREHINDTMIRTYNSHPEAKYIGMFDFVQPRILLRDPELIKSVAIKHFDNFPDHLPFCDPSIDPLMGSNLFHSTGEHWRETRNLLSPAFTSSKMKNMYELLVVCARNFVDHLGTWTDSQRKMLDMKDLFSKYANDTIATSAFGISIDSLKDPNNDFYVLGKEATNVEKMTLKLFISRSFPGIMKWLKIRFIPEHVVKFFKDTVETAVSIRDSQGITRPDMIQLMMNARGKESQHLTLDLMEMTRQAFIFFFAGFETTSTQMCVMAHELAVNPDIQRRLQDEVDEVMARSQSSPSYEDIQGMMYLDAVFNEAMRRHTQANNLDRVCVKEFELPPALPGGRPFTVKPGTIVWIASAGIHMDPKYYENPRKFDPDRYHEKRKVSNNDATNLGFGIGPRSCIGSRFAMLETKILFCYILSTFNFKPTAKTNIPLKYDKKSFIIRNEGGFWLEIERRVDN